MKRVDSAAITKIKRKNMKKEIKSKIKLTEEKNPVDLGPAASLQIP